ncbi:DNA-binding protein, partial [Parabacteroides distasonis]|nr:DNA-binding protein [Parabacteroides distasonis]
VIYVPSAEIKEAVSMYSFSKAGASAANEDGEGGDEKPNPKPDEGGGEAPDPAA